MKAFSLLLFTCASAMAQCPLPRIAISADGNWHDRDDICAAAIEIALLAKTGNQARLVHCDYADHYWQTDPTREELMRGSVVDTATQWGGFDPNVFFNATQALVAAVAHLTAEIDKSTAADPLVILSMGPMQVIGLAVAQSDTAHRGYVTLASHSPWNDNHATAAGPKEGLTGTCYSFNKIGTMGVKLLHIVDQNAGLNRPYTEFYWLRDSADPKLRWLWDRGQAAAKSTFDCSDAGAVYCELTGDPTADPTKLNAILTAP